MPSSPDTTLQPITNPDANIHTGHASSSLLPPSSPFPPISAAVSNESTPVSSTSNDIITTDKPLQVAEECHARKIQILEEKHAQDLEALKRAHALELIETKRKLYAQHQWDLLQLKEASELGLRRLRAFFLAVKGAMLDRTYLPAGGETMELPLRIAIPSPSLSTIANASSSTLSSPSCRSTRSHGSPSVAIVADDNAAALPTPPPISPLPSPVSSLPSPISPLPSPRIKPPPPPQPPTPSPNSPHTPSATNTNTTEHHVHFLTTGLSLSEAKKVACERERTNDGVGVRSSVKVGAEAGDGRTDDGGDEKGGEEKGTE